jgi:hypothetical protein
MGDAEAHARALTDRREQLEQQLEGAGLPRRERVRLQEELVRVRQEIDGARSSVSALQARVGMSQLSISYESGGRAPGGNAGASLSASVQDFGAIVGAGLGVLVRIVAFLIPWLIGSAPLAWLALHARRKGWFARRPKPGTAGASEAAGGVGSAG